MGWRIADATIVFGATIKGFEAGATKVEQKLKAVEDKARELGSIGARAFLALAGVGAGSIFALSKQEDASARLAATLRATGGAAGYTAGELERYATSLAKTTKYADEDIISITSIMTTFMNIQGRHFKESISLAADLSSAFGQDLRSSAIQLGKALNDPVQGYTALRRVGVSFSDVQEKQIKDAMAVGDTMTAQRVILDELTNELGGTASAAADTFTGRLTQLKNEILDAGEALGSALIPYLQKGVATVTGVVRWFKNMDATTRSNIVGWGMFAAKVAAAAYIFPKIISAFRAATSALKAMTGAQAVLQALSGPKGWAVLAAGAAIALGTVAALDRLFAQLDEVAKTSDDVAEATESAADGIMAIGTAAQSTREQLKTLREELEKMERQRKGAAAKRLGAAADVEAQREATQAEFAERRSKLGELRSTLTSQSRAIDTQLTKARDRLEKIYAAAYSEYTAYAAEKGQTAPKREDMDRYQWDKALRLLEGEWGLDEHELNDETAMLRSKIEKLIDDNIDLGDSLDELTDTMDALGEEEKATMEDFAARLEEARQKDIEASADVLDKAMGSLTDVQSRILAEQEKQVGVLTNEFESQMADLQKQRTEVEQALEKAVSGGADDTVVDNLRESIAALDAAMQDRASLFELEKQRLESEEARDLSSEALDGMTDKLDEAAKALERSQGDIVGLQDVWRQTQERILSRDSEKEQLNELRRIVEETKKVVENEKDANQIRAATGAAIEKIEKTLSANGLVAVAG